MNMLKHVIVCVMLAGGVFVVFGVMGCEQMCATRIVESVTVGGKMVLAMQGSPESLIEQGRIDAHRRVAVADGAEIDVWVIKARPNDGSSYRDATVVVIHPLMMSKGWFFSLGEQLAANGWDVVLPDLRAHGASGGKYVTWGAKDKRDIKTVVDKLLAEEIIEPKLYAMGASLGGCVAIQYAAFDTRCQGVLALAPPTGVNGVARRMYPLATQDWLDRTVVCAGELAGFDATDASAIDAAGKLKCPLILAHGRLDIIVPHNHSEQIYQAASGPKKLISLPLTNHVTVQVGQSGWIVRQMSDLAQMTPES
ncbi:MAG: alpha/beta fold hydrolase [Phycisphaerales bacterium]|jgi:pimeloyl-ACP methyl ester carboxylesterase|nr:alpha/beta fold hydrolase [Phycisphaerales bacterium]